MKRIALALAAIFLSAAPALAQLPPCPVTVWFAYGYVPTSGQWQSCWNSKQNQIGYVPVNKAGDAMSGRLVMSLPGAMAGLNLPPGVPNSPANGDLWTTADGLFVQAGGVTRTPYSSANTVRGNNTGSQAVTTDLTISQLKAMLGLTPAAARFSSNTAANPTGTTSATAVMMGLGSSWALTPAASGNIVIAVTGYITNSAAAGLSSITAYRGTGSAPANGAAFTGTAINSAPLPVTSPTTGSPDVPFSFNARVTGLTVNTAYWFDLGMSASAGTSTVHITTIIIKEE